MLLKNKLMVLLFGAAILTAVGSTLEQSDVSALQGTWRGKIMQETPEHQCSLVISGKNYEFRDETDTNVWYKGTFTVRADTTPPQYVALISKCPFPQYVGKTSQAIYRIESGTLTIAANEPGNAAAPAAFDNPNAARMVLKRK